MKNFLTALVAMLFAQHVSAQTSLTKREIKTIRKTHEVSMLAISIAKLAPSHAATAETKAAAQRLSEDYTQIRQQVESLAAKKNVSLEREMPQKSSKIVAWYDKKQGKDFDKAYLKGASKVNKGGICHAEKVFKRTDDPDVKDWSGKLLSTLEMHKTLLKQTCDMVKKSH